MSATTPRPSGRAGAVIAGTGIGLRSPHIREVLESWPAVPWFEILADNHTAAGGPIAAQLTAIRERYPITLHSVGLSLGSTDPLDQDYLAMLKGMLERYEPAWLSDHLCFSSLDGTHYHDLLPLPYTEEAVQHAADRIVRVQDYLGQSILIENVSTYLTYAHSTLTESAFLAEVCTRADCDLLLDINNVYVNEFNHGCSGIDYLDELPLQRVREIHLGGYEDKGDFLLDAHNHTVSAPVWALYRECMRRIPNTPTLVEWDNDIPDFAVLQREAARAQAIADEYPDAREA